MRTEPTGAAGATPISPASTEPVAAAATGETDARAARLAVLLGRHRRLLVAFSAGVDSTYLLYSAVQALGRERVLAVTGVSPSLPERERQAARELAGRIGAPHRFLETHELQDPRYAANPSNRCYFCKSELYAALTALAAAEGFDAVADGTNLDDTREVRPGRLAAGERGITSPLLEAEFRKSDIRELSRRAGLPTWDKPEMPCLASRIPYGSPVEEAKLRQIEAAEDVLLACGIRGARVRHHGDLARVELPAEDLARLAQPDLRRRLVDGLRGAGFEYVTVDLEGYRRGRLNEAGGRATVEFRAREPGG